MMIWKGIMFILFATGVGQVEFPSEQACFSAKPTVVRALEEEGVRNALVICVRVPTQSGDK